MKWLSLINHLIKEWSSKEKKYKNIIELQKKEIGLLKESLNTKK